MEIEEIVEKVGLSPEQVAIFFEEDENIPPEEIKVKFQELRNQVREVEFFETARIIETIVDVFVKTFPVKVRAGIAEKVKLETTQLGDCEEPGARNHFLKNFQGLVWVEISGARFQWNSNRKDFVAPKWLQRAIEILNQQGWQCQLKTHIHADFGVGNTMVPYLCVPDPRQR